MGHTNDMLDDVRAQIAASNPVLAEARTRLSLVRGIAMDFPGALRSYGAGSLVQFTVNDPVTDGDGGLVLDRRVYPQLGPEGGGDEPEEVTADLCAVVGPQVRETYPKATCGTSKRGPKVSFASPIEGQDPTVDLVVALTRRDGAGLWIPNLENNTWEPSDPEEHVRLLNHGPEAVVHTRRLVTRLAKAWNKQFSKPGFSSFNLAVLARDSVTGGSSVADALATFFKESATSVRRGSTPDPASVSAPLKLLIPRDDAVRRLTAAADNLAEALEHDDDELAVRTALAKVFWNYIDEPASAELTHAVRALRSPDGLTTAALGVAGAPALIHRTRAYGVHHR